MNRPSVLIVGYGIVGKNLHKEFPFAKIADPMLGFRYPVEHKTTPTLDYAFICVPTPMHETTGECVLTYVHEAIERTAKHAKIIILKSTVPPGTCEMLEKKYGIAIVFSPEYYGETHHANRDDYNFVIFGGRPEIRAKASQLYQHIRTGDVQFQFTDWKTAELTKYMENTFLAMKVTFANEFYRIAQDIGVSYPELRELFVLDPRVNPSHTFVYDEAPYYESKCLDKDVPAIVAWYKKVTGGKTPYFIGSIIECNRHFKKAHNLFIKKNKK